MPLLESWHTSEGAHIAIWKITEPEAFFADRYVPVQPIAHEIRRMEHLAGRCLLQEMQPDFDIKQIHKDKYDKPRLPNDEVYFSISHSFPYVAAIIDHRKNAGIDIQVWKPSIDKIRHKYLSDEEQQILGREDQHHLLAWCAKEATYKQAGLRGIDFKGHMEIADFHKPSSIVVYSKINRIPQMVYTEGMLTADFALSYVSSQQDWAIY